MVIETQRLILREMIEDDFDALYKVLADSDKGLRPELKKRA